MNFAGRERPADLIDHPFPSGFLDCERFSKAISSQAIGTNQFLSGRNRELAAQLIEKQVGKLGSDFCQSVTGLSHEPASAREARASTAPRRSTGYKSRYPCPRGPLLPRRELEFGVVFLRGENEVGGEFVAAFGDEILD